METLIPSELVSGSYEIYRLAGRLTIVSVVFVPIERFFAAHPQKVFRKQTGVDLAYYVMNSLIVAGFLSIPVGMMAWGLQQVLPTQVLTLTAALPMCVHAAGAAAADDAPPVPARGRCCDEVAVAATTPPAPARARY